MNLLKTLSFSRYIRYAFFLNCILVVLFWIAFFSSSPFLYRWGARFSIVFAIALLVLLNHIMNHKKDTSSNYALVLMFILSNLLFSFFFIKAGSLSGPMGSGQLKVSVFNQSPDRLNVKLKYNHHEHLYDIPSNTEQLLTLSKKAYTFKVDIESKSNAQSVPLAYTSFSTTSDNEQVHITVDWSKNIYADIQ